ncbi:hypothetical protein [uncultured Leifsonia sp.]|uniref:hypothetical protein n=1 Tax=uncultured Leifsonia sp. TaxID=340359 RepID=UPI0028D85239|nr:hypothetical protein [uncultured Leifsonia sp.]
MTDLERWLADLNDAVGADVPPEIVTAVLDLARDVATTCFGPPRRSPRSSSGTRPVEPEQAPST